MRDRRPAGPPVEIGWHSGPRDGLRPLFELAEDSQAQLAAYLELGRVLVARTDGRLVGHLQVIDGTQPDEVEVKNMAVTPDHQGRGVGRALLAEAVRACRAEGRSRLTVATAAADTGNLRFYQRTGFRMLSVERDAFTPATGYPDVIRIDGIELRDRVWLSMELTEPPSG